MQSLNIFLIVTLVALCQARIPSDKSDWSVPYPDYSPVKSVATCPSGECDPEDGEIGAHYNSLDGSVDRKRYQSACKNMGLLTYNVVNGLPQNPAGRMGITGRGQLQRFGPNHITRILLMRSDKLRPKILVKVGATQDPMFITDSSNGNFIITGEFKSDLEKQLLSKYDADKVFQIFHKTEDKFKTVLAGSTPSQFETDNAWVEQRMMLLHCMQASKLCRDAVAPLVADGKYKWVTMKEWKAELTAQGERMSSESDVGGIDLSRYSSACKQSQRNDNSVDDGEKKTPVWKTILRVLLIIIFFPIMVPLLIAVFVIAYKEEGERRKAEAKSNKWMSA